MFPEFSFPMRTGVAVILDKALRSCPPSFWQDLKLIIGIDPKAQHIITHLMSCRPYFVSSHSGVTLG